MEDIKHICNGCGKTFPKDNIGEPTEMGMCFTYGSRHDSENWTMYLCDDCVDDIADRFEYPPLIEGRD